MNKETVETLLWEFVLSFFLLFSTVVCYASIWDCVKHFMKQNKHSSNYLSITQVF